jgi:SAM-dependent methyltransferase
MTSNRGMQPGRGSARMPWTITALLCGSGFCALIYQVAWQRELRLVFGASTAASAAVLAIFIGGLGLGGWYFGPRADRHRRPLVLYSWLEIGVAVAAAATPALVWLIREAYVAVGGSIALGPGVGTLVRLVLAAVVLLPPTILMGGTLPAAARAVAADGDRGRGRVAVLYGANTLGAVVGCAVATFFLLEMLGTHTTLWCAALLNVVVALCARPVARGLEPAVESDEPWAAQAASAGGATGFVYAASAIVGFAFFLMEMVWYRMLGPILGGTIFAFGLILTVALLGVGVGAALYAGSRRDRPATLSGFAISCLLEAVFIALPFALGDRLAIGVLMLKPLTVLGFTGHLLRWLSVCAIVVLPAAVIAGLQFPWLVGLLGHGRRDVARQLGYAYAWNTAGAITGALAGGFVLLPLLTAPGCWRLVTWLLAALGVAAAVLACRRERSFARLTAPAALVAAALLMVHATGPTAFWRHNPIGMGRAQLPASANALRDWIATQRRTTPWETEGVESSVALNVEDGLAFIVNGKSDGNAIGDTNIAVMGGLVAAALHPEPQRALVIGLGTGTTAGWLAAVPSITRVDAVELEPAVLEVARRCGPVNRHVMDDPKVHVQIGDAREVVLTARAGYDVVFSQPSNPFRAGIASLFSREYYQGIAQRLRPGGVFVQWVQAYEVDSRTVGAIYATLASVFPHVETWQTDVADLLLVAALEPLTHDVEMLRARLGAEPYRTGMAAAWRVTGVEGFYSHYVAGPALARAVANEYQRFVSTDDQNFIEFGFARTVSGATHGFGVAQLRQLARRLAADRPPLAADAVDWPRVREQVVHVSGEDPRADAALGEPELARLTALRHYLNGQLAEARAAWQGQEEAPRGPVERLLVAETLADAGDEEALLWVRDARPAEALAVMARLRFRQGRRVVAVGALREAFFALRTDPWPFWTTMHQAMILGEEIAAADAPRAAEVFTALEEPFVLYTMEEDRKKTLMRLARHLPAATACERVLRQYGDFPPWTQEFLTWRAQCFRALQRPELELALGDLTEFLAAEPRPLYVAAEPADTRATSGRR